MAASVVIVEDHLLLAEVLRAGLIGHGIEATLLEPTDLDVLAVQLIERAPDLVLLDLDLGAVGDSTALIALLGAAGIRTVVVSGTSDRRRIAKALEAGAFGYCAKSVAFDDLTTKIAAAVHATEPLDTALRADLERELNRLDIERRADLAPFERLTEREQETLRALAVGMSVRDITASWVVSEATVRTHVRGVLAKLDAPSQLAAVAAAFRAGWLDRAS
ncbi:MAG: response regulator [Jatrophihabitantaceae bacterium]